MLGLSALNEVPLGDATAATPSTPSFSISPSSATTTGPRTITATGILTTWGASNPFSVSGGPGTISAYSNPGPNPLSATFSLNVTALTGGPIVIADSNSGTSRNFSVSAPALVVPNAPTGVVLTDNHNGTVTATYTQSSIGAPITGNSLLSSAAVTASASSAGAAITFNAASGVPVTAQVRSTNAIGTGAYSSASASITPTNLTLVRSRMIRAPYLTTDTVGTKQYRLYDIISGVLTAVGSVVTTGFVQIDAGINNGWWVKIDCVPNGPNNSVRYIAIFDNVNGSDKAAAEVYLPGTTTPSSLEIIKLSTFLATDTIGTPGYRLTDMNGVSGSVVTSGVLAVTGVANKYAALITLTPDAELGAQRGIRWTG